MRRFTLPLAVMALSILASCKLTDDPNKNDIETLRGSWIRIASNNPTADGMIVKMEDDFGTITDKAGSAFKNGDI